nr:MULTISPECIES: heme-binding protein [unclassified Microbacterium]
MLRARRRATERLSFRAAGGDFDTDARLDTTEYAAHGGVFPLTIAGVGVVGTVGVSGLPQADDHAFVVEQLRAWIADISPSDS